jgi:site-specific recombinase XerD
MNSGKFATATATMEHLMNFLVVNGVIAEAEPRLSHIPKQISDILSKYDEYLSRRKGLSVKTRGIHRAKASAFIDWLKERHECVDLSALDNDDILDYQKHVDGYGYTLDYKKTVTNCLRGFLRFLRWERVLDKDLTPAVFKVIDWSLSSLPRYMPFDDVKILLQAPDRNTPGGKRDIAMLILMAYLGLRACEVVNLHISDIDFAAGEILIRQTKTYRARKVPLTIEIAEILIDYIKNGRDNAKYDELFIRTVAPRTPIRAPSSPGTMIRKYLKDSGLKIPKQGTHVLRHSLATHLINNGSTLKDIADLLGHKNIQSTTIYAKVQVERLKDVALPFPVVGGVSL